MWQFVGCLSRPFRNMELDERALFGWFFCLVGNIFLTYLHHPKSSLSVCSHAVSSRSLHKRFLTFLEQLILALHLPLWLKFAISFREPTSYWVLTYLATLMYLTLSEVLNALQNPVYRLNRGSIEGDGHLPNKQMKMQLNCTWSCCVIVKFRTVAIQVWLGS